MPRTSETMTRLGWTVCDQVLLFGIMHGKTRAIVQTQSFWEIHDGHSTLFWEDAWEQLPVLQAEETMQAIQGRTKEAGWTLVHHYWEDPQSPNELDIKKWKPLETWMVAWTYSVRKEMEQTLAQRMVTRKPGLDILRWGQKGNINFSIREAYQ
jgi:hypothetical protein